MCGCGGRSGTEIEPVLNAQQANGRQIYDHDCAGCHNGTSSSGSQGPNLKGLFRKKYLPSGLPTNDRFVEQTIVGGRGVMPAMGDSISDQQLMDLVAYLHTL